MFEALAENVHPMDYLGNAAMRRRPILGARCVCQKKMAWSYQDAFNDRGRSTVFGYATKDCLGTAMPSKPPP